MHSRPSRALPSRLILILVAAGLGTLAAALFLRGRHGASALTLTSSAIAGFLAAAALYVALRLQASAVRRIAREALALIGAFLVADALIAYLAPDFQNRQLERMEIAARLRIPFDSRTKSQVVSALREQGIDALPGVSREWPRAALTRQQLPPDLFPLANAGNSVIVECNETGTYLQLRSDEFGFNNPAGTLSAGRIPVAVVGDSFAFGHCIDQRDTLLTALRGAYPGIANLGIAGSNALSMLGTFREYVEPKRPPLVLWMMHPHNTDVAGKLADPLLQRYLDPRFSQNLLARQAEVDRSWREIGPSVQAEIDRRGVVALRNARKGQYEGLATFTHLRVRAGFEAVLHPDAQQPDMGPFLRCLKLAQHATESWGGRFVVVLMPLYEEVVARQLPRPLQHDALVHMLRDAGIDVIDPVAVFESDPDPARLYTMRVNNHPDAAGYALLSSYVLAELRRRGLGTPAT